jgi:acyl-CoA synthetase (AMP-forming)/AMP-acid ligase II/acyl carrier protein
METNIINILMVHALRYPEKNAFIYLSDGTNATRIVTYGELMLRVRQLTVFLSGKELYDNRVMLVYQDTIEFIITFLACQYAGVIPVPVFFNRSSKLAERLTNIIVDAEVGTVCTVSELSELLQQTITTPVDIIATDKLPQQQEENLPPVPLYNNISFIQYTSGSTGTPKGVVISSRNLLHNQELITKAFYGNRNSVILSWLPFHHDMGLIGNILHTIYLGCTGVLMSPLHFMQSPINWLKAVAKYKVTHSGGPNFAFDLCVDKISPAELASLDLSSWILAFNGAEPVRADTISRFTSYFSPAGFSAHSFYPCYGLAEATLMVSGGKAEDKAPQIIYIDSAALHSGKIVLHEEKDLSSIALVSAGRICDGMDVKIINKDTQLPAGELEQGEICIAGDSVTAGYWKKDNSKFFYEIDNQYFLRTGDIGFLYRDELFINGREKEMLIIRGANYYPYDIEKLVADAHPDIVKNGVAVCSIGDYDEHIVIVTEIKRTAINGLNAEELIGVINTAVSGTLGIPLYDIVLTTPLGIPRTTSGKLQRLKCKEYYLQRKFNVIGAGNAVEKRSYSDVDIGILLDTALRKADYKSIRDYLVGVITSRANIRITGIQDENTGLNGMGLDSLRAMDLMNTISKDLNINIDASKAFQQYTFSELVGVIESMLWLKKEHNLEKGIVI